jgi:glutamate synthase domain-containing protein 3
VGRADLVRARGGHALDATALVGDSGSGYRGIGTSPAPGGELGRRLAADAEPALAETRLVELSYPITNSDRAVGARLGGVIAERFGGGSPPGRVRARFEGSAGQSFGAFLSAGTRLALVGEANDAVGKGMAGGRIVVRPPAGDAGDPVLIGNAGLYGATGGELFCSGRAGDRFAVRNSGAVAVVEGAGDHLCEYMTGGTVVVLGPVGRNVGAGMSGGELYVYDPDALLERRLNEELVEFLACEADVQLRELVARHARSTGSPRAEWLLGRWAESARAFALVRPKRDVAELADAAEQIAG